MRAGWSGRRSAWARRRAAMFAETAPAMLTWAARSGPIERAGGGQPGAGGDEEELIAAGILLMRARVLVGDRQRRGVRIFFDAERTRHRLLADFEQSGQIEREIRGDLRAQEHAAPQIDLLG